MGNKRRGCNTHGLLLNVDLDKLDAGVLVLELGKVGTDELAWSTPGCPVVDNDGLRAGDLESALAPTEQPGNRQGRRRGWEAGGYIR